MKTKAFFVTLALIIIVLIGYRFFWNGQKQTLLPSAENSSDQVKQSKPVGDQNKKTAEKPVADTSAGQASPKPSSETNSASTSPKSTFSSGAEVDLGPDISVVEIDYEAAAFTPSAVDIKVGDYVIFKNKSQADLWVASNPHPTHTDYPEFNSQKPIPPGGKFQFQFLKAGNFGYHNHLNPSATGTINVSQR